ncbi:MAG: M20/M25/M40 family metallo-hydrolase [Thermodesulfobacteriota bacterium]
MNRERLAATFAQLCEIDSPSRSEGRVAAFLKELCARELAAEAVLEDDSAAQTGAECGNVVVRFGGTCNAPPLFFNCHMDTVQPGVGVKVRREGDTFTSAGATVLGGDDKAGIAALIEAVRTLKETNTPHAPFELIFTTCEEIGLLGAKHLDFSLVRARMGYALDSSGIDLAIVGAPAANRFVAEIHGLAAHAGLHPEKGISAIQLAARAMAHLPLGRLDAESTANIGLIQGGTATNIIPERLRLEGEVRSHDGARLAHHTARIEAAFRTATAEWHDPAGQAPGRPRLDFAVEPQYPAMRITETQPVWQRLAAAAKKLDRPLEYIVAGGGSDANIFNAHGLATMILGIGMTDVHTTEESVTLDAMTRTAELACALLTP